MRNITFIVVLLLFCVVTLVGCDASATLEGDGADADGPTEILNAGVIGGADGPTQIILGDGTSVEIPTDSVATAEAISGTAPSSTQKPASQEGETMQGLSSDQIGFEAHPTANPAYETIQVIGTVAEIDTETRIFYIEQDTGADESGNPAQDQIGAVLSDATVVMDSQTGEMEDSNSITAGQRVCAYVGIAMTRSIPPQAQCYALVTNLPANDIGIASYVRPIEVTRNGDGSVVLLNQNADLYITIPSNLKVEVYTTTDTILASKADIEVGDGLMVWYDRVAYSFPGQTTATRVTLLSMTLQRINGAESVEFAHTDG